MAGQDCEDAEWKRLPYNTYSQTGLRSLTRRKRKRKMKQSPSVSKYQDVGAQQLSPLCVKLNFLFIFFFVLFSVTHLIGNAYYILCATDINRKRKRGTKKKTKTGWIALATHSSFASPAPKLLYIGRKIYLKNKKLRL